MSLKLGFSFCPNDTFIFYALSRGLTRLGSVDVIMADVEELNNLVIARKLDISKISVGVFPEIYKDYILLDAGSAFGESEAPVVVSKSPISSSEVKELAVPGKHTTAFLLYRRFFGEPEKVIFMRYDRIMHEVKAGRVQAGILIHEGRFTYKEHGLSLVADLGKIWRDNFGELPIPLGGVVLKRELFDIKEQVEEAIRESIRYAEAHSSEVMGFVKRYAQELSDDVVKAHIRAFVNRWTWSMNKDGRRAVEVLLGEGLIQ